MIKLIINLITPIPDFICVIPYNRCNRIRNLICEICG